MSAGARTKRKHKTESIGTVSFRPFSLCTPIFFIPSKYCFFFSCARHEFACSFCFNRLGGVFQLITLSFFLLLLHLLFHTFLAHLSMLNVSFWDRVMSVVWASETSVTSETAVRQLFAFAHSRWHSFDLIYMKLREKVNLYEI